MREPKDYHKALSASQTICITFYLVVSIIVYLCCGQYLTSPALGSAGPVIARVLYALALPGMTVGAVLFTHLSAKWALVKMLRGSEHLQKSTVIHWVTWLGAVGVSGLVSFTVAESIPFFSGMHLLEALVLILC